MFMKFYTICQWLSTNVGYWVAYCSYRAGLAPRSAPSPPPALEHRWRFARPDARAARSGARRPMSVAAAAGGQMGDAIGSGSGTQGGNWSLTMADHDDAAAGR